MAKTDTIKDIKDANGQDAPEALSQKQLDELLVIAKRDGTGSLDAYTTKLGEFQGAKAAPKENTIKVRVNDAIAAFGGEFTDPGNRRSIGKVPVDVPVTPFVREKLRSEELVEVE